MNIKRIALLTTAMTAALALAGCGGGRDEETAPVSNAGTMAPIEIENVAEVPTEAPAAPRIENTTVEAETVPTTLSADEQTQDDADATGMTARVSRDEPTEEPKAAPSPAE